MWAAVRVALAPRLALCLAVYGCTGGADGGAIELSWKLRPASGATSSSNVPPFLDCSTDGTDGTKLAGTIDSIQLDWQTSTKAGHDDFRCTDGHGVTHFEVPPGPVTISVEPVCGLSVNPRSYEAPAPAQRTSLAGDVIDLGAVEIIVQVTNCSNQPCICQ